MLGGAVIGDSGTSVNGSLKCSDFGNFERSVFGSNTTSLDLTTMGRKIYVNGYLIIKTKFFVPKELGCGYPSPPENADTIEATDDYGGVKCLLVDDNHPQSLFNEYYAKEGVNSGSIASSYLSASYLDSIYLYKERIAETCEVIKRVSEWEEHAKSNVYRMAFVSILTSLDAFICYVLLKRSLDDEALFEELMYGLAPENKKDKWEKYKRNGKIGEWEQDAIKFLLNTSFVDCDKIDKAVKNVKLVKLKYNRKEIGKYFRIRHVIVHRSGKQMDDNQIEVTYKMLGDLINACHSLVGAFFDSICITYCEERKDKPKERDIEEVFPGGIVTAPFKLSDLRRLLLPVIPFEPIEMPTLG